MTAYAPAVRIALRYLSGLLVGWAATSRMLADVSAEPVLVEAIAAGLGVALGVGTEWAYAHAKRLGWAT